MAVELTTLKCPHCGEASGLIREGLGRYKCKFCGSTVFSQGNEEGSLIVLPTKKEWDEIHNVVRGSKADNALFDAHAELNKAFPVNLEAEITSIDAKSASEVKVNVQGLAGELASFPDKGKAWNRLAQVLLRIVFCRSLFGDFDTVAQIVADIKECDAVNPHFWVKLYQNYFLSGSKGQGDLTTLLSISRIKDSLREKDGSFDEAAYYEFAEFLAKHANDEKGFEFYVAFAQDTLNDKEFVSQVYPTRKLLLSKTLRKHVHTLNKAYLECQKGLEGGRR